MKLIIDTNIIIASLIKDSIARKIIFLSDFGLFAPEFALSEINKYKDLILSKSALSGEELDKLLSVIFEKISFILQSQYEHFIKESEELLGKVDQKDTPFLALALSTKNDGIWSDDTHFKKQNKIRIWTTKEMFEYYKSFQASSSS